MKRDVNRQGVQKNHPICVRWNTDDYKFVVDESWRRRIRISEMIRRLVLDGLKKEAPIEKNNA